MHFPNCIFELQLFAKSRIAVDTKIRRVAMRRLMGVVAFLCFLSCVATAAADNKEEILNFEIGTGWKNANVSLTRKSRTYEFTHPGDDIKDWKELVTIQNFAGSMKSTPEKMLDDLKTIREKEYDPRWRWLLVPYRIEYRQRPSPTSRVPEIASRGRTRHPARDCAQSEHPLRKDNSSTDYLECTS
jgi:hypothetical protein